MVRFAWFVVRCETTFEDCHLQLATEKGAGVLRKRNYLNGHEKTQTEIRHRAATAFPARETREMNAEPFAGMDSDSRYRGLSENLSFETCLTISKMRRNSLI